MRHIGGMPDMSSDRSPGALRTSFPSRTSTRRLKVHPSREYISYMQQLYDSGIAYTDAHVGEFLDYLMRKGMYDKSMILVMSDHGEEFGEHGMFFHGNNLYENVLQVPLLVKNPGQQRSVQQSEAFPLIDLYPSIAELAGAKCSPHIQGHQRDLSGLSAERSATVFSSLCLNDGWNMRSMERNGMHFMYNFTTKRKELYDLKTDPTEQQDLSSKLPDETEKLYDELLAQEHDTAGRFAGQSFSPEEQRRIIDKAPGQNSKPWDTRSRSDLCANVYRLKQV